MASSGLLVSFKTFIGTYTLPPVECIYSISDPTSSCIFMDLLCQPLTNRMSSLSVLLSACLPHLTLLTTPFLKCPAWFPRHHSLPALFLPHTVLHFYLPSLFLTASLKPDAQGLHPPLSPCLTLFKSRDFNGHQWVTGCKYLT